MNKEKAQKLYFELRHHIEEMPDRFEKPLPGETRVWLAKAHALVKEGCNILEGEDLKKIENAINMGAGDYAAEQITGILHRAFYAMELEAPASLQGAFIPVGADFDALAAMAKILQSAKKDVLIVDPYMDEKVLTDFAVLANEQVKIRLLTDEKDHKLSFKPAVMAWLAQRGGTRPLEAKLMPPRKLHDRFVQIDGKTIYWLSQSLNAFAARSPGTIDRLNDETATMKTAAYEDMWESAAVLLP